MGVVKILSGSKSFSAVDYNEERVRHGEAVLLSSNGIPQPLLKSLSRKEPLKNYFKAWSSKNNRIKDAQFHVAISVKGQEYSRKQLQVIGEAWLKRMGYGDNPYLIYFHNNTNNNHIHIVTSRVNRQGNKINHNFEKERAVRALDEILGTARIKDLRRNVASLSRFSFETKSQFLSLLQAEGYNVYQDKTSAKTVVYKNRMMICTLTNDLLMWLIQRQKKELAEERKKQIRAFLVKYGNLANTPDEMNALMKKKLGVAVCMYGKPGSYYGYNIIDYKNKTILKGSPILNIKFLTRLMNQNFNDIDPSIILQEILSNNRYANNQAINTELKKFGFRLKDEYIVNLANGLIISELDSNTLDKIKYNNRLSQFSNTYHPVTDAECRWVAKTYSLNFDDVKHFAIINGQKRHKDIDFYSQLLSIAIEEGCLKDVLDSNGIKYIRDGEEILFLDYTNKKIFSSDSLHVILEDSPDFSKHESHHFEFQQPSEDNSSFIDFLLELYPSFRDEGGGGSSLSNDEKKRKKRKRL